MQSSVGARDSRRAVCVSEIHPAEFGLVRVATLADGLMTDSTASSLLVWRSQPALLVTRQDMHLLHFRETSDCMTTAGWPVVLRGSGGGACPVGPGTVQVASIEPALPDMTMNAKYDALAELIRFTLRFFNIVARTGSVTGAFCPGSYDLAVDDKKIAGMSQHWFRNRSGIRCVVTAACINVEEAPDVLANTVNQFYRLAGSPARCQATALTSVRLCGGSRSNASNLTLAVMNQLVSNADMRAGMVREDP